MGFSCASPISLAASGGLRHPIPGRGLFREFDGDGASKPPLLVAIIDCRSQHPKLAPDGAGWLGLRILT